MHYDAIVIGAGPGGYSLAEALAAGGLRTAVIERDEPGGTCLNRGCIPTKTFCASGSAPWPEAAAKAREVVQELREGIRGLLAGVEYIHGDARLLPGSRVEVNGSELRADRIFIATGSAPARLPIPGADLALDSTQFLALDQLPDSVAIIGAGVIGLEFASILLDKGVEVTVIEYCKEILPPADAEVAKRLRSLMKRRGAEFITGAAVKAIKPGFSVEYEGKKGPASVEAALVIMATGRRPVLPEGCSEAGIALTPRGFIAVDPATMETSVPGIYAVGDCNGLCLLAHAAEAQGARARGLDVNLDAMPSVVFTRPACAWVGPTEEQLAAEGTGYRAAKALYASNGKAMADGTTEGFVKVLADPASGRILAVHILGASADALIGEATLAVASGLTVRDIALRTVHPHPTLTELFASACRNLL